MSKLRVTLARTGVLDSICTSAIERKGSIVIISHEGEGPSSELMRSRCATEDLAQSIR